MIEEQTFAPGERITHSEFGAGVVLDAPHDGYLRAFFSYWRTACSAHQCPATAFTD